MQFSALELLQENNRERAELNQSTPRSSPFCGERIQWSVIWNWCTVEGLRKYIFPRVYLPVIHLFHILVVRCYEEQNFRNPECAAF